jgi:hypothetical protein
MRSSVTSMFALVLALAPAAAFAQTPPPPAQQPPTQQPPTQQPPAGQPPAAAQPAAPAAPKVGFTAPAGLLLVQVKPDQTTAFEEMMEKIKKGVETAADPAVKAQAGSWHYYKATEPAGANVMYIVVINPAKPDTEYQFLEVLNKTLTDDQKRDPATQEMYKKYAGAIASMNKLNITPVGGGL